MVNKPLIFERVHRYPAHLAVCEPVGILSATAAGLGCHRTAGPPGVGDLAQPAVGAHGTRGQTTGKSAHRPGGGPRLNGSGGRDDSV